MLTSDPCQKKFGLIIYLFIYLTLPKTFNRFTNRHLDNKHGQERQGHHNSVNQLLWALYTIIHTILITHTHSNCLITCLKHLARPVSLLGLFLVMGLFPATLPSMFILLVIVFVLICVRDLPSWDFVTVR